MGFGPANRIVDPFVVDTRVRNAARALRTAAGKTHSIQELDATSFATREERL